jgi:hypothetical protein
MEADQLGDVDVAHQLAETIESAELFLYPAIDTCSLTTASPTTTKAPRRSSSNECSASSTTSSSG